MTSFRMALQAGALLALFAGPAWAEQGAECKQLVVTTHPAYKPLHWYDGKEMRGASMSVSVGRDRQSWPLAFYSVVG